MSEFGEHITYFEILTRYFNLIYLLILEFHKPMAEKIEMLGTWTRVKELLVTIAPVLQTSNVLHERRLAIDEVILIVFLLKQ